jgi:hypothetical protein
VRETFFIVCLILFNFFLIPSINAQEQISPSKSLFKGNSSFGIEANLLTEDKYDTGVAYTPQCLQDCHLPIEFKQIKFIEMPGMPTALQFIIEIVMGQTR